MKQALKAVPVLLLAAVPGLGLTTLVPGAFSHQQPQTNHGTGPDVVVSNHPFTFDAPTATLQRLMPGEAEGVQTASREGDAAGRDDAVVLTDWKFTQFSHRHRAAGSFQQAPLLLLILQELTFLEQQQAVFQLELLLFEQILLQIVSRQIPPQSPFR